MEQPTTKRCVCANNDEGLKETVSMLLASLEVLGWETRDGSALVRTMPEGLLAVYVDGSDDDYASLSSLIGSIASDLQLSKTERGDNTGEDWKSDDGFYISINRTNLRSSS
jgi:hypothetical protein